MNTALTLSKLRFFCLRFVLIFFMLVAVFGVIIHYDASSSRDAEKSNIRVEQKALLEGKKQYIEWVMSSIMRETALLADIVSAKRVYEITDLPQDEQRSEKLSRLRSILEAVSQRKEVYDLSLIHI